MLINIIHICMGIQNETLKPIHSVFRKEHAEISTDTNAIWVKYYFSSRR